MKTRQNLARLIFWTTLGISKHRRRQRRNRNNHGNCGSSTLFQAVINRSHTFVLVQSNSSVCSAVVCGVFGRHSCNQSCPALVFFCFVIGHSFYSSTGGRRLSRSRRTAVAYTGVDARISRRPVDSHSGARETIIEGPYHNLIPNTPRLRRRRRRKETWGGCPLTIRLWVCGSVVSSPVGSSPGRKLILCIFEVRKKPSGTPFSEILALAGPPNVTGQGKLPPSFPPLDGPDITATVEVNTEPVTPEFDPRSSPSLHHCQAALALAVPISVIASNAS